MSELLRKEYEISLWDEEIVYIITETDLDNRYETVVLPEHGNYQVLNQYIKENCLAIIGSDKLDTPIKAFSPKLVQKVNGENTFSFQIYSRYFDEEDEEFKANPFINLLVNERKIKLHYDGVWYDFIIKEVQEKSEGNIFSYTC